MNCTECGKVIVDYFKYCPYCGKICLINKGKNYGLITKTQNLEKIGLVILNCLSEIKFNAGRSFLSKVLQGSKSKVIFQTKQQENPYFGVLNKFRIKRILKFMDELISTGYMRIDNEVSKYHRPILILTSLAEEHIKMNKDVPLSTYHQRLKKIKTKYPHAYELWGSEDITQLIQLFGENKPINEIANLMGRQRGGIRSKLKKLNLIKK